MGWHPDTVRKTHLRDFMAAFEGWQMVNCPPSKEPDFSPEARARLDAIVEEEEVKAWQRRLKAMTS